MGKKSDRDQADTGAASAPDAVADWHVAQWPSGALDPITSIFMSKAAGKVIDKGADKLGAKLAKPAPIDIFPVELVGRSSWKIAIRNNTEVGVYLLHASDSAKAKLSFTRPVQTISFGGSEPPNAVPQYDDELRLLIRPLATVHVDMTATIDALRAHNYIEVRFEFQFLDRDTRHNVEQRFAVLKV